MPAKKLQEVAPEAIRVLSKTLPEDAAREALVHKAIDSVSPDRDLVNQLLGQAQMAEAIGDFSRTVRTSKLAYVKENKLYRALAGQKTPDGPELAGTWQEFCGLLGRSVDQIDSDIANLRAFGEQALESMSRMGIGYRELRQYRRLSEDSRTALIAAAQDGDKEGLLDLAEELIAKQQAEKAALQKSQQEAEARATQLSAQLSKRDEQIDDLKDERRRLRREWSATPVDERVAKLRQAVQEAVLGVVAAISPGDKHPAGLHAAVLELLQDEDAQQLDQAEFLAGCFTEVIRAVRIVRDNLPVAVPVHEG